MSNFTIAPELALPDQSAWLIASGELFSDDQWPLQIYAIIINRLTLLGYHITASLPPDADTPLRIDLTDGCAVEISGDWGLGMCHLSAPERDQPSISLIRNIALALSLA
jgi:hypothetical protein